MVYRIMRKPQAVIGLIIIIGIGLIAVFAPLLAPHSPDSIDIMNAYSVPSHEFPLGTDEMGRCMFSRILYGARNSLGIAAPTLILLALISTTISLICAYYGGLVDQVFSAVCNIFMAFPPLIVAITLVGSLGQGFYSIFISILLSQWAWFAKVTRTFVIREKHKEYIIACKISGCNNRQLIINHILPGILPHLIVYYSTGIASIILTISGYAFLGLGFAPGTPEWGAMFSGALIYIQNAPQLLIYPGICIVITTAGFNLFGEAFRDILLQEEE